MALASALFHVMRHIEFTTNDSSLYEKVLEESEDC